MSSRSARAEGGAAAGAGGGNDSLQRELQTIRRRTEFFSVNPDKEQTYDENRYASEARELAKRDSLQVGSRVRQEELTRIAAEKDPEGKSRSRSGFSKFFKPTSDEEASKKFLKNLEKRIKGKDVPLDPVHPDLGAGLDTYQLRTLQTIAEESEVPLTAEETIGIYNTEQEARRNKEREVMIMANKVRWDSYPVPQQIQLLNYENMTQAQRAEYNARKEREEEERRRREEAFNESVGGWYARHGAVPKRRISSRSRSVSKKSKKVVKRKTRSQYAKKSTKVVKKVVKRKARSQYAKKSKK